MNVINLVVVDLNQDRRLTAERNYCFICRPRIAFNIDKIYRINKIQNIILIYFKKTYSTLH